MILLDTEITTAWLKVFAGLTAFLIALIPITLAIRWRSDSKQTKTWELVNNTLIDLKQYILIQTLVNKQINETYRMVINEIIRTHNSHYCAENILKEIPKPDYPEFRENLHNGTDTKNR